MFRMQPEDGSYLAELAETTKMLERAEAKYNNAGEDDDGPEIEISDDSETDEDEERRPPAIYPEAPTDFDKAMLRAIDEFRVARDWCVSTQAFHSFPTRHTRAAALAHSPHTHGQHH